MNSKQTSINSMLRRVSDLIKRNLMLLSGLPIFMELWNLYGINLTQIGLLIEHQEKDISGLKKQKEVYRVDAIKKVLDISRRVVTFARLTGNEVLAQEAYYSETDLNRLTDDVFVKACRVVYTATQNNATVLLDYGVTADTLAATKTAIDTFEGVMDTPKEGATEKKQSTDGLASLLDEELAVLTKIDLLVNMMQETHPEFYAEYKDTRKVVYRSGSLVVKGAITDAATGAPLSGVTVSFALNGAVVLEKSTATGGGFSIKSMEEGAYDVTVSKLGYKTVIQTFNVLAGELATLEVKLEKN
jgi:hypothetical protein